MLDADFGYVPKNYGTSLGKFVPNSELEKFRHGTCLDVPWTVVCLCRSVLHKSVSSGNLASDDDDDGLLELTS